MILHYLKWDLVVGVDGGRSYRGRGGLPPDTNEIYWGVVSCLCLYCRSLCWGGCCLVLTLNYFATLYETIKWGRTVCYLGNYYKRSFYSFICGTGIFHGPFRVIKPETTFADGTSDNENPIFGNPPAPSRFTSSATGSAPPVRILEPKLEAILPKMLPKASVIFIDRNIHH